MTNALNGKKMATSQNQGRETAKLTLMARRHTRRDRRANRML